MKYFFDTNILVYLLDARDTSRHQRAVAYFEQSLKQGKVILSTQVLHELVSVVTYKLKPAVPMAQISERLAPFFRLEVIGSNTTSVQSAIALMQQHQTSWWDALILEAALRADADVLVSEDFSHGQRFGKLLVENPLLA